MLRYIGRLQRLPSRVFGLRNNSEKKLDKLDTSFNNPVDAFKSKTTSELVRALLVYQICSIGFIVDNNEMLMKKSQKVLGKKIFEILMKATFYGQFVAGEDTEKIKPTVRRLMEFGVKSILDYSVEEDMSSDEAKKREVSATTSKSGAKPPDGAPKKQFQVDERFADRREKVTSARTYIYLNEDSCDVNVQHFLKSIEAVHDATHSTGLMAVKLTAIGRPQLLLQISEVIVRAREYMTSLSGDGKNQANVMTHKKTIADFERYLGDHKSKPEVQDFIKHITTDAVGVVHLFPWSDIITEDMALSDTFRVPDPKTGQMRRLISQISPEEEHMFHNMLVRLNKVIKEADKRDVRVMVDAEQTYFQPAISRITMETMRIYNKDKFTVWNTYQTYLKNTYNEITWDLDQAERQGFNWAAKTVRGAYMEQERARALAMKYEDPICENFDATTASYHKCLGEVLTRSTGKLKGKINVMAASHNEDTVRFAIKKLEELKIDLTDKRMCFGQLLGMCDHVTFPLGQAGLAAYKYVPYGPVTEVLPYLSRRANENRGFLAKIKKEKRLLRTEIFRRLKSGQLFYKPKGPFKLP